MEEASPKEGSIVLPLVIQRLSSSSKSIFVFFLSVTIITKMSFSLKSYFLASGVFTEITKMNFFATRKTKFPLKP